MIALPHPYRPNRLGAVDENGNVPCWCGYPKESHAQQET